MTIASTLLPLSVLRKVDLRMDRVGGASALETTSEERSSSLYVTPVHLFSVVVNEATISTLKLNWTHGHLAGMAGKHQQGSVV